MLNLISAVSHFLTVYNMLSDSNMLISVCKHVKYLFNYHGSNGKKKKVRYSGPQMASGSCIS